MDSIQEILGKKDFTPPDELTAIKEYISRRYKNPCSVKVQKTAIVITVEDSALAATIHLERQALIDACAIKKRLIIRTGSTVN